MTTLDYIPRVRPATPADLSRIEAAAKADRCGVLYPTHYIEKNKEIVGYISLGVIPMVAAWLDSKKVKARDSFHVGAFIDDAMSFRGVQTYSMPIHSDSPSIPYFSQVGCINAGQHTLFLKSTT